GPILGDQQDRVGAGGRAEEDIPPIQAVDRRPYRRSGALLGGHQDQGRLDRDHRQNQALDLPERRLVRPVHPRADGFALPGRHGSRLPRIAADARLRDLKPQLPQQPQVPRRGLFRFVLRHDLVGRRPFDPLDLTFSPPQLAALHGFPQGARLPGRTSRKDQPARRARRIGFSTHHEGPRGRSYDTARSASIETGARYISSPRSSSSGGAPCTAGPKIFAKRSAPKRAAFEEPGAAAPGSARGEPQALKGRPKRAIFSTLSILGFGWHLSGAGRRTAAPIQTFLGQQYTWLSSAPYADFCISGERGGREVLQPAPPS